MKDKKQIIIQGKFDGKTCIEISKENNIPISTVYRILSEYKDVDYWKLPKDIKPNQRIIGCIPDIHFPFSKDEYIEEVKKIFRDKKVTDIVILGDIVDQHTLSTHPISGDSMGTIVEYNETCKLIQNMIKEFPIAYYCMGNHCERIMKKASLNGFPSSFIKSFKELYNIPDTWIIDDKFIIDDVLYTHGTEFNSRTNIVNVTSFTHHSTVIGHTHTQGGIFYTNTGYDTLFCLCCGCLIDESKYAFNYSKHSKYKPIKGIGIVYNSKYGEFIPIEEK